MMTEWRKCMTAGSSLCCGILVLTAFALTALSASAHDLKEYLGSRPNIVLLYADDLGYGELGSYGQQEVETPYLDELARKGMRFTQFYAGNAVCAPSRASLMTGKHPGNATIRGNSGIADNDLWYRVPLRHDEETMAEMFKSRGYVTALFGKYHCEDPRDVSTWAHNRGFDYTLHMQWDIYDRRMFHNRFFVNGEEFRRGEVYDTSQWTCLDEFYADRTVRFLRNYGPGDKPFFVFVSLKAPHTPMTDLRDDKMYADRGWPELFRKYAARITHQDKAVGRIVEELRWLGLENNTLVIYTSDHGPHAEDGMDPRFFRSAGGLRGIKRDLYEGGIRVPMIAYWQDHIPPATVSDHVSAQWDYWATFAELAGAGIPEDVDGISMLPTLLNKGEQQKHQYLYWELQLDGWWQELPTGGFRQAVRMGDWKAVRYQVDGPTELYNLAEDRAEARNLAAYHPDIVGQAEYIFRYGRSHSTAFPYGGKIQNHQGQDRCTVFEIFGPRVESPF